MKYKLRSKAGCFPSSTLIACNLVEGAFKRNLSIPESWRAEGLAGKLCMVYLIPVDVTASKRYVIVLTRLQTLISRREGPALAPETDWQPHASRISSPGSCRWKVACYSFRILIRQCACTNLRLTIKRRQWNSTEQSFASALLPPERCGSVLLAGVEEPPETLVHRLIA